MAVSVAPYPKVDSDTPQFGVSSKSIPVRDANLTAITKQVDQANSDFHDEDLLIVSPYDERPHLLNLQTLDTANQLLARALTGLKCLREDYATAPYMDIFNWPEVVSSVQELAGTSNFKWNEASFYIVVFRSRIPPTTKYADLGVLDKAAHAEATQSGGFLK